MKYLKCFLTAHLALILLLTFPACTKEDTNGSPTLSTIQLKTSPTLGTYLADSLGYTLYYFSNDFDGNSSCTGGCLNVWPIYYAGDNLTQSRLPAGLDISDFGTITTTAGAKQTTYKTWPLYYYAPVSYNTNTREKPGETNGEGVGKVWFVAKPDYSIMLVNAQLVGKDGKSYKGDYTEGTGKTLYFSDAKGVTLYGFTVDSFNVNKFTKPDFSNNASWPIYETDQVVVPSILDKSQFGKTNVFGKTQLTYNGWPLYYFGSDKMIRGLNKGVSVPAPGVWPVMVKDAAIAPK